MQQNIDLRNKYPEIDLAPISMEVPLLWGDMDSAQHVNNLIYLKWSETARIMLFTELMDTSFKGKEGPILGWHDCKYIFPMTYPDTALVTIAVTDIKTDRFMLETKIYSCKHTKIAAISTQSTIPYNYESFKKIDMPQHWIAKLEDLKGRS